MAYNNSRLALVYICVILMKGSCHGQKDSITVTEDWPSDAELSSFKLEEGIAKPDEPEQKRASNPLTECSTLDVWNSTDFTRNGVMQPERKWRVFQFYFESEFARVERRNLNIALQVLIQAIPCLPFNELESPAHHTVPYVVIRRANQCGTLIGNHGSPYKMDFNPECLSEMRLILHQFVHAIGVEHEHSRPDRDDYIEIHWDNIKEEKKELFKIMDEPHYFTYGVHYNKKSVMQIDMYSHNSNGERTMSFKEHGLFALDQPMSFGPYQDIGLQKTDVRKLRRMYGCDDDF